MEIGGIDRRKARLTSQISVLNNKKGRNHREGGLDSLVGLTVDAVLGNSQELYKPIQKPTTNITTNSTRTLLDIISEDESGSAYRGLADLKSKKKGKKSIKDRLKFRRPGSSSSSHPVPTSDFPINNRRIQQISNPILIERTSLPRSFSSVSSSSFDFEKTDFTSSTSTEKPQKDETEESDSDDENEKQPAQEKQEVRLEPGPEKGNSLGPLVTEPTSDDEEEEKEEKDNEEEEEDDDESGRMIPAVEAPTVSLMALLEESGRRVDEDDEDEEEEEEDDEEEEEDDEDGEEYECTVCMVKHRGYAFVPCGHTFCRLCSKELWVSRGNCPLCTAYILEILDIF